MGLWWEIEARRIANAANFHVLFVGGTNRDFRIRQIGYRGSKLKQFFFDGPEGFFFVFDLLGHHLHFVAFVRYVNLLPQQFSNVLRRRVPQLP